MQSANRGIWHAEGYIFEVHRKYLPMRKEVYAGQGISDALHKVKQCESTFANLDLQLKSDLQAYRLNRTGQVRTEHSPCNTHQSCWSQSQMWPYCSAQFDKLWGIGYFVRISLICLILIEKSFRMLNDKGSTFTIAYNLNITFIFTRCHHWHQLTEAYFRSRLSEPVPVHYPHQLGAKEENVFGKPP